MGCPEVLLYKWASHHNSDHRDLRSRFRMMINDRKIFQREKPCVYIYVCVCVEANWKNLGFPCENATIRTTMVLVLLNAAQRQRTRVPRPSWSGRFLAQKKNGGSGGYFYALKILWKQGVIVIKGSLEVKFPLFISCIYIYKYIIT